jgi:cell division protease FtsH
MAEDLVFGEVSSGAADDLARATEIAGKMVREWGMSERIGPMAWRGGNGQVFLGEDMGRPREYSDEMAHIIDEEIERILRDAEQRCRVLLTENRNGLDLVARSLLEHETIDGPEVGRLLEIARTPGPAGDAAVDIEEPVPDGATADAAATADAGATAADAVSDDMAAATRNDVPGY